MSSTALYLFVITIGSTIRIGGDLQNYMFTAAAATLTSIVRSLSFTAIPRQDSFRRALIILLLGCLTLSLQSIFFDRDEKHRGYYEELE